MSWIPVYKVIKEQSVVLKSEATRLKRMGLDTKISSQGGYLFLYQRERGNESIQKGIDLVRDMPYGSIPIVSNSND